MAEKQTPGSVSPWLTTSHLPNASLMPYDPNLVELVWENGQIVRRGLSSIMFGDLNKIDPHKNNTKNSLQTGYQELLFSELYDKRTVNNFEHFNQSNNVPRLDDEMPRQTNNNDRQVPISSPCLAAAAARNDDLQGKPNRSEPRNESVPDEESEADGFYDTRLPSFRVHHGRSSAPPNPATEGKQVEQVVPSSSECSRGASNTPIYTLKSRYHEDTDLSDVCKKEETNHETNKAAPSKLGSKRKRKPEVHSLSEKRRRDKFNKKMQALQELIPNCNKIDKASMLDEAIEYLKTLQLQVQMMSMGRTTGVYMPQMILPPASGLQHISVLNFGGYSPMGIGMQMGLGYNQATQFPSMSPLMAGINQARVNMFGLPGQMLLMSAMLPSTPPFVSSPAARFPPQLVRTPAVSQAAAIVAAGFTQNTSMDLNRTR